MSKTLSKANELLKKLKEAGNIVSMKLSGVPRCPKCHQTLQPCIVGGFLVDRVGRDGVVYQAGERKTYFVCTNKECEATKEEINLNI